MIGSIIIGVSMGEMWSYAAGSVGERWKNRFPGIMSACTGRSSPMISNWLGKVTWGINGVTGEMCIRDSANTIRFPVPFR